MVSKVLKSQAQTGDPAWVTDCWWQTSPPDTSIILPPDSPPPPLVLPILQRQGLVCSQKEVAPISKFRDVLGSWPEHNGSPPGLPWTLEVGMLLHPATGCARFPLPVCLPKLTETQPEPRVTYLLPQLWVFSVLSKVIPLYNSFIRR